MFVFRGIEDALGVSEQVLASFIADGRIEVDLVSDVESSSQLLQLFLMLDVLGDL